MADPIEPADLHAQVDREYGPCHEHAAELLEVTVYSAAVRPVVDVEVDGQWVPGEVRRWLRSPAGERWADVTWHEHAADRRETFTAIVPDGRIRVR